MTDVFPTSAQLTQQGLIPSDLTPTQVQARCDLSEALDELLDANTAVPVFEKIGILRMLGDELLRRTRAAAIALEQQQFQAWEAQQAAAGTPAPAAPTPPATAPIAPSPPTQQG